MGGRTNAMVLQVVDLERFPLAGMGEGKRHSLRDRVVGLLAGLVPGVLGGRAGDGCAPGEYAGEQIGIGSVDGPAEQAGKGGKKWES